MVTPGGETAFISRIIAESIVLGERCQWYTSLLGKLSSVSFVVDELKAKGIKNWCVKEFVTGGGKTRRWGVGWSWGSRRPREDVCRGVTGTGVPKHLLPFPTEFSFRLTPKMGIDAAAERLNEIMEGLELQWQYRSALATGVGFAKGNVWSRAARRKQLREGQTAGSNQDSEDSEAGEEEEEPALGTKISLTLRKEGGGTEVMVRWLVGRESVLFESFCGMLRREMMKEL
ncbi:MAG: hypothetical protein Q9183_007328 [Haloplaca sp. 2 TL-2023]